MLCSFFFFNDTATTEIYTLSLHDALPIYRLRPGLEALSPESARLEVDPGGAGALDAPPDAEQGGRLGGSGRRVLRARSEEHTSELQSRQYLVCRLLLEKKKKQLI